MQNDLYEKYEAVASVEGELIICKDASKLKKYTHKIKSESYSEYLETLKGRDPAKDQWVHNIIDGLAEQEHVLYRDSEIVIIPSYSWNRSDLSKMHILCFPTNKSLSLKTIRDLSADHIELLNHMKTQTLRVIADKYALAPEYVKRFFHYEPSAYYLHIHFMSTEFVEAASSVEYSHDLSMVIFNLSIDSEYYRRAPLNIRY